MSATEPLAVEEVVAEADACLPFGYVGKNRQLAECNGYTRNHLPEKSP